MSEQSADSTHYSTESLLQVGYEKLARTVQNKIPDYLEKSHRLDLSTSIGTVALENRYRIARCNIAGELEEQSGFIIIAAELDLGRCIDAWQIARNRAFSVTMQGQGALYPDTYKSKIWTDNGFSLESQSGQGSLDLPSIVKMSRFIDRVCGELAQPSRDHLSIVGTLED